jgi:hypothetical protein
MARILFNENGTYSFNDEKCTSFRDKYKKSHIYIYIYFAFLLYYYCLRNYVLYNGIYMFSNSLHPQSRALKQVKKTEYLYVCHYIHFKD